MSGKASGRMAKWDLALHETLVKDSLQTLWNHLPYHSRASLLFCSIMTTRPQAGVSILTQWLCSDVSQASAIVLYKSTFQRAGKWKKCGCQCCTWMEPDIYLIWQGRARVWGGDHEVVCVLGASGPNTGSIVRKKGWALLAFTLHPRGLNSENKLRNVMAHFTGEGWSLGNRHTRWGSCENVSIFLFLSFESSGLEWPWQSWPSVISFSSIFPCIMSMDFRNKDDSWCKT